MSHGIEKPVDKVYSLEEIGLSWHGLDDLVPEINRESVRPILAPIKTGEIQFEGFPLKGYKSIVADYRGIRDDLEEIDQVCPLHVSKESYQEIDNLSLFECAEDALRGVDAKISSVGTLSRGKVFFLSAMLGKEDTFKVNGDDFLGNLNLISSHNGTLAVECYDSLTRIVCMNTLKWSRSTKGEINFKVYHTKNSALSLGNMAELVNQILTGRADFCNQMEYLESQKINKNDARHFLAGWLTQDQKNPILTTRTENRVDEILYLFEKGQGNKGKTLYDVLNGITEYFTSGEGTGKRADEADKWAKSEFGSAADYKRDAANVLIGDIQPLIGWGAKAYKNSDKVSAILTN